MNVGICQFEREHRQILDEDKPGWTDETVWCQPHRTMHRLLRAPGQLAILPKASDPGSQAQAAHRHQKGELLADGTLCFHGNPDKSGPAIYGACAYCNTRLHVHHDALGGVKSGRHGAAYMEERCPACHRPNAVYPDRLGGGIRTERMVDGAPVLQMKLSIK